MFGLDDIGIKASSRITFGYCEDCKDEANYNVKSYFQDSIVKTFEVLDYRLLRLLRSLAMMIRATMIAGKILMSSLKDTVARFCYGILPIRIFGDHSQICSTNL